MNNTYPSLLLSDPFHTLYCSSLCYLLLLLCYLMLFIIFSSVVFIRSGRSVESSCHLVVNQRCRKGSARYERAPVHGTKASGGTQEVCQE